MKDNDPWVSGGIQAVLAEYRRQLEMQGEQELQTLIEHYELSGHDKQSCIDELVEHYRQQLEGKG